MNADILVTGGVGFISSHLVDALVERGEAVRVLDDLEAQLHGEGYAPENLTRFECPKVQRSGGDPLRFEVCERRPVSET